jgi:hypothetical protein
MPDMATIRLKKNLKCVRDLEHIKDIDQTHQDQIPKIMRLRMASNANIPIHLPRPLLGAVSFDTAHHCIQISAIPIRLGFEN